MDFVGILDFFIDAVNNGAGDAVGYLIAVIGFLIYALFKVFLGLFQRILLIFQIPILKIKYSRLKKMLKKTEETIQYIEKNSSKQKQADKLFELLETCDVSAGAVLEDYNKVRNEEYASERSKMMFGYKNIKKLPKNRKEFDAYVIELKEEVPKNREKLKVIRFKIAQKKVQKNFEFSNVTENINRRRKDKDREITAIIGVSIEKYIGSKRRKEIVISNEIRRFGKLKKRSILDINDRIFENANSVSSIDIEEGIKRIKRNAFVNASLTKLRIPKTVMEIERTICDNPSKITIYCEKRSFAREYAQANGYKFDDYENY